jgi:3-dehydroquinate synthase
MTVHKPAAQAATSAAQQPTVVHVSLGERAYDIVIGRGVLHSLGARVAALRPGVRTAIVTDHSVAKHWLAAVEASLAAANVPAAKIVVGEGEGTKSYAVLEQVS